MLAANFLAALPIAAAVAGLAQTTVNIFTSIMAFIESRKDRSARLQLIASQDSQVCERVRCE
jgi:hypothetical protein